MLNFGWCKSDRNVTKKYTKSESAVHDQFTCTIVVLFVCLHGQNSCLKLSPVNVPSNRTNSITDSCILNKWRNVE